MKRDVRETIVFVALFFLVLAACPGLQTKPQTNTDLYYGALGYWQNTMDNFKLVYNGATEAEQKDMLPAMELMLSVKKNVINTWKVAIANNDPATAIDKNAAWKKAKNQIILEVVDKFMKEGK